MGPITKPMAPSDLAGKISYEMSNFQSCNYHILQNNVKKHDFPSFFTQNLRGTPLQGSPARERAFSQISAMVHFLGNIVQFNICKPQKYSMPNPEPLKKCTNFPHFCPVGQPGQQTHFLVLKKNDSLRSSFSSKQANVFYPQGSRASRHIFLF